MPRGCVTLSRSAYGGISSLVNCVVLEGSTGRLCCGARREPVIESMTGTATVEQRVSVSVAQCQFGSLLCCNTIQSAAGPGVASLLGLLGIVNPTPNLPVGFTCTPIPGTGNGALSMSRLVHVSTHFVLQLHRHSRRSRRVTSGPVRLLMWSLLVHVLPRSLRSCIVHPTTAFRRHGPVRPHRPHRGPPHSPPRVPWTVAAHSRRPSPPTTSETALVFLGSATYRVSHGM